MEKYKTFEQTILKCNKQAMDYLHTSNLESALKLLKNAEKAMNSKEIPKTSSLWGITYNNFGCVYKKANNFQAALHYLTRALNSEIINAYDATNAASTHLNISAILSNIGDHNASLAHAQAALKTLQDTFAKSQNSITSLIISYHAIGIENEYLRKIQEAAGAFKKGWDLAEKELGQSHKLTDTLRKCFARLGNLPNVGSFKAQKKPLKIKKSNENFVEKPLPSISKRNIKPNYFTNLHRSSEDPYGRLTYYAVKTRSSLSPITTHKTHRFDGEIESINKIIKDIDTSEKPKTRPVKQQNHKEFIRKVVVIQKYWRGFLARRELKVLRNNRKIQALKKNAAKNYNEGSKKDYNEGNKKDYNEGNKKDYNEGNKKEYNEGNKKEYNEGNKKNVNNEGNKKDYNEGNKKDYNERNMKNANNEGNMKNVNNGKSVKGKGDIKRKAAVKIQSHFRMWKARMEYKRKREAAIQIQKVVKGWKKRKIYLLINDAVVFIQSVYRGHRARKQLKYLKIQAQKRKKVRKP